MLRHGRITRRRSKNGKANGNTSPNGFAAIHDGRGTTKKVFPSIGALEGKDGSAVRVNLRRRSRSLVRNGCQIILITTTTSRHDCLDIAERVWLLLCFGRASYALDQMRFVAFGSRRRSKNDSSTATNLFDPSGLWGVTNVTMRRVRFRTTR